MVVDDFNGVRIAARPTETDAPLIVHANTVLPRAIAEQLFQMISGRQSEFVQAHRRIDEAEFPEHDAPQFRRKRPNRLALPEALGIAIGEAANHVK